MWNLLLTLYLGLVPCPEVDRLADPHYATREAATKALAPQLLALPAVAEAARTHPDPEVRWRCSRIAFQWYRTACELEAVGWLVAPGPDHVTWEEAERLYRRPLVWAGMAGIAGRLKWEPTESARFEPNVYPAEFGECRECHFVGLAVDAVRRLVRHGPPPRPTGQ